MWAASRTRELPPSRALTTLSVYTRSLPDGQRFPSCRARSRCRATRASKRVGADPCQRERSNCRARSPARPPARSPGWTPAATGRSPSGAGQVPAAARPLPARRSPAVQPAARRSPSRNRGATAGTARGPAGPARTVFCLRCKNLRPPVAPSRPHPPRTCGDTSEAPGHGRTAGVRVLRGVWTGPTASAVMPVGAHLSNVGTARNRASAARLPPVHPCVLPFAPAYPPPPPLRRNGSP